MCVYISQHKNRILRLIYIKNKEGKYVNLSIYLPCLKKKNEHLYLFSTNVK